MKARAYTITWHKPCNQQINNRLTCHMIQDLWGKCINKNVFCLSKNPGEGYSSKPELPGVNSVKGGKELVYGGKGRGLCAGRSELQALCQGLMSVTFIIVTGITALIWIPWHARFFHKDSFKLLIFLSVLRQLRFSFMQPLLNANPALTNKKQACS